MIKASDPRAFSSAGCLISDYILNPCSVLGGSTANVCLSRCKDDPFLSMVFTVALEECQMMFDPVDTSKDAWALVGLSQSQTCLVVLARTSLGIGHKGHRHFKYFTRWQFSRSFLLLLLLCVSLFVYVSFLRR